MQTTYHDLLIVKLLKCHYDQKLLRRIALAIMEPDIKLLDDDKLFELFVEAKEKILQDTPSDEYTALNKRVAKTVQQLWCEATRPDETFKIPYSRIQMQSNLGRITSPNFHEFAFISVCKKLSEDYNPRMTITKSTYNKILRELTKCKPL